MKGNEEPESLGEYGGHEIYPMPMFVTVAVKDVAAASEWYVSALGFAVVFSAPGLVHLRRNKYQDVLIVPGAANEQRSSAALAVSFSVDDLDELATQARAAETLGLSAIEGPVETPWNSRDLRVTDPAGNRLVFTARNMNATPEQRERIGKMLDAQRRRA